MKVNLHTHTPRCRHASGSEREYIEAALAAGLTTLGFSDHAPMIFAEPGYYSTMRMHPEELAGYVETLLALREEYRGRIGLRIGLELEYYPDRFGPTCEFLAQFPLDYLILGQHYLFNEIGSAYVASGTTDPALLRAYADQCCAGMETGRFTYLAHPDVFRFDGDPKCYRTEMERLCRCAIETGTPLELNLLGASAGRHYPTERFWAIAGEFGNPTVLGCDAHKPSAIPSPEAEARCRALARRFSLPLLEDIPLRKPF